MDREQVADAVAASAERLLSPLEGLWGQVTELLPRLAGFLLVLLAGYLVAVIGRRITAAALRRLGLDAASRRLGIRGVLDRGGISAALSAIIGTLVFWLLLLTFLVSATEVLGIRNVSETVHTLIRYLPNLITALLIAIGGLVAAHILRDLIRNTTESIGVEYAGGIAGVTYAMILLVVASLAVGQLQIETTLFDRLVEIVLIASIGALGLALGLGTRDIAKQVIAGAYARETFRPGTSLVVGDDQGALLEVGAVSTRLRARDGRTIHIPNSLLTECVVREGDPEPES